MKKAVRTIIAASAVATVVGIGAVSFAAWSEQGSKTTDPITGNTGEVLTRGISVQEHNLSGSTNVLVPWNQTADVKAGTTAVKYWAITLQPTTDVSSGYTVKITDNGSAVASGALKVFTGSSWSLPSDSLGNDFKAIGADTASVTPISNVVYLVLDSESTADMGKKVSITITLN